MTLCVALKFVSRGSSTVVLETLICHTSCRVESRRCEAKSKANQAGSESPRALVRPPVREVHVGPFSATQATLHPPQFASVSIPAMLLWRELIKAEIRRV